MSKFALFNLIAVAAGTACGLIFGQIQPFHNNENARQTTEEYTPLTKVRFGAQEGPSEVAAINTSLRAKLEFGSMTEEDLRKEFYKQLELSKTPHAMFSRNRDLDLVCEKWAEVAPKQALEAMRGFVGHGYVEETIMAAWVERDPEAAIEYYMENRDDFHSIRHRYSYSGMVKTLAKDDPDRALKFLSSLSMDEKSFASRYVLEGVLACAPERMQEFVDKITETGWMEDDKNYPTALWSEKDNAAYEAWAATLPEEKRLSYAAQNAVHLAQTDPEAAGKILEGLPASAQENALKEGLFELFDKLGTADTFDWIISHTSADAALASITPHLPMIRYQDYVEMFDWTEQLPPGKIKDTFAEKLASQRPAAGMDFERAISLANSIGNEEKKKTSVHKVILNWSDTDYDAAAGWVEKSGLSSQDKEKIKNDMDERKKAWIKES